jgi:hypothetical protein
MNNVHAIPNRARALSDLLAEERQNCYRDPARRAALLLAERVTEDQWWYHNNENAVQLMRGMAFMARKMAKSSSIHQDLSKRLTLILQIVNLP